MPEFVVYRKAIYTEKVYVEADNEAEARLASLDDDVEVVDIDFEEILVAEIDTWDVRVCS